MSRNRRSAGGGAAVRGPASALTSFLAGLGVEPPTRLTTWDTSISNTDQRDQNPESDLSDLPGTIDPAGTVTARNVVAGPSEVGEGTPVDDITGGEKKRSLGSDDNDNLPVKRSRLGRGSSVNSDDLDAESVEGHAQTRTSAPSSSKVNLPQPLKGIGEFMNCGECSKRFTVTAYTKEHPTRPSNWLCINCCYDLKIDPFAKPKKVPRPKANKKEDRAKLVHHEAKKGATALAEICIQLIGRYIEDVDQLGDIGSVNLDKVCKIISRSRRLTPETAPLFYSADRRDLTMYDCTLLVHNSYISMADLCPNVTNLTLHLCGQLSTEAVTYWAQNMKSLHRVELLAPFLVRKDGWLELLSSIGSKMQGFSVTQSPRIDLEIVEELSRQCTDLSELRLSEIGQLSDVTLRPLARLRHLEHLDLSSPGSPFSDDAVTDLLAAVGHNLVHLNLSDNPDLTDSILSGIAAHCPRLRQLILRNLTELTDMGVSSFFATMKATQRPGLEVIDLEKGHDLKGKALGSLVAHSGDSVEKLSLLGWREVEQEALKGLGRCRSLRDLNLGWCREVTDFSVKDILDSCEKIQVIRVWGCNQLTDAVPRKKGVQVIGIETHSI